MLIQDIRCIIVKELASMLNISVGSVEIIVKHIFTIGKLTPVGFQKTVRKWNLLPHSPYSLDIAHDFINVCMQSILPGGRSVPRHALPE